MPVNFVSQPGSGGTNTHGSYVVSLDKDGACFRPVTSDNQGTLVIPTKVFDGVMVEVKPGTLPGSVCAKLILKHSDDTLSVVLCETDRPEDLASAWPAWSKALGLPMLVRDLGGRIKPIEAFQAEKTGAPHARRKLSMLTGRRPRFLVRRKTGNAERSIKSYKGEREIIARS
nr:DUF6101 family protein [Roseibium hamelinense]